MYGNQELNPQEDMWVEISGTCPVQRSVLDPILVEIWPWGSPPKGSADQRVEALGIRHPKRPFMVLDKLVVRARRASAIQLMGRPKEMDSPRSRTLPDVQEIDWYLGFATQGSNRPTR